MVARVDLDRPAFPEPREGTVVSDRFSPEIAGLIRRTGDLNVIRLRRKSLADFAHNVRPQGFVEAHRELSRDQTYPGDNIAVVVSRKALFQQPQDPAQRIAWVDLVAWAIAERRRQFGTHPGFDVDIMTAAETVEVIDLMRRRREGLDPDILIPRGTSVLTSSTPSGRPGDSSFVTVAPTAREIFELGVHDLSDLSGDIVVWPVLRPTTLQAPAPAPQA